MLGCLDGEGYKLYALEYDGMHDYLGQWTIHRFCSGPPVDTHWMILVCMFSQRVFSRSLHDRSR